MKTVLKLRRTAVGALALIVALIPVPWHLSPGSARVVGVIGICLAVISAGAATFFARFLMRSFAAVAKGMLTVAERSAAAREHVATHGRRGSDARDPFDDSMPPRAVAAQSMTIAAALFGVRMTVDELLGPLPLDQSVEENLRRVSRRLLVPSNVPWRYVGVAWFIVGLVAVWTSVSLLVWAAAPAPCTQASGQCGGAFTGLPLNPTVGDFVYFTINAAIANVLPDITARSPAAHLVFTATMLSGLVVLARYAKLIWADIRADLADRS